MGNLEEMDNFLETVSQDRTRKKQKYNRQIISSGIESVIRKILSKQTSETDDFKSKFHKTFKEELISIHLKLWQKFLKEGMVQLIL